MNDKNFEIAYKNLKEAEGGYTDGKNQMSDEPTNMGIKQSTMDKYARMYPCSHMPNNVKDLTVSMAREIYRTQYWDNTKIPQILNMRIRNAIFDMNVMSGISRAVKTAQIAINKIGRNVSVDGVLGAKTLYALNAVSASEIEMFMIALKEARIEFLQKTQNWPTAKNGWTRRTMAY